MTTALGVFLVLYIGIVAAAWYRDYRLGRKR